MGTVLFIVPGKVQCLLAAREAQKQALSVAFKKLATMQCIRSNLCKVCCVLLIRAGVVPLDRHGSQGPVLLHSLMGKCEFPTDVLPTLFVMAVLSNKGITKVLRLFHLIS